LLPDHFVGTRVVQSDDGTEPTEDTALAPLRVHRHLAAFHFACISLRCIAATLGDLVRAGSHAGTAPADTSGTSASASGTNDLSAASARSVLEPLTGACLQACAALVEAQARLIKSQEQHLPIMQRHVRLLRRLATSLATAPEACRPKDSSGIKTGKGGETKADVTEYNERQVEEAAPTAGGAAQAAPASATATEGGLSKQSSQEWRAAECERRRLAEIQQQQRQQQQQRADVGKAAKGQGSQRTQQRHQRNQDLFRRAIDDLAAKASAWVWTAHPFDATEAATQHWWCCSLDAAFLPSSPSSPAAAGTIVAASSPECLPEAQAVVPVSRFFETGAFEIADILATLRVVAAGSTALPEPVGSVLGDLVRAALQCIVQRARETAFLFPFTASRPAASSGRVGSP